MPICTRMGNSGTSNCDLELLQKKNRMKDLVVSATISNVTLCVEFGRGLYRLMVTPDDLELSHFVRNCVPELGKE